MAGRYDRTRVHADLAHKAVPIRLDLVLHLHGFHDHERLPALNGVALHDLDGYDRPLYRRRQADGAARARQIRRGFFNRTRLSRLHGSVVIEQCKRIGVIDLGAGKPALRLVRTAAGVSAGPPRFFRKPGRVLVHPPGRHLARPEVRVLDHVLEERNVRLDAFNSKF